MLGDLPRAALVNYIETINGVDYGVQYTVYRTALENPYGNGHCMMVRLRATWRCGLDGRCEFSDDGSVEYTNSTLDDFLNNEYAARFDEKFLQAVKTSDVVCCSKRDRSSYVLHRQFLRYRVLRFIILPFIYLHARHLISTLQRLCPLNLMRTGLMISFLARKREL